MARRLCVKRVVEYESRLLKTGAQIAVRPLNAGLARRHLAFGSACEVLRRPLEGLQLASDKGIAFAAGIRSVRPQALEGIDDERQRLQIERDVLDGFCRGQFVDGRHGENRLALVERLVRK